MSRQTKNGYVQALVDAIPEDKRSREDLLDIISYLRDENRRLERMLRELPGSPKEEK